MEKPVAKDSTDGQGDQAVAVDAVKTHSSDEPKQDATTTTTDGTTPANLAAPQPAATVPEPATTATAAAAASKPFASAVSTATATAAPTNTEAQLPQLKRVAPNAPEDDSTTALPPEKKAKFIGAAVAGASVAGASVAAPILKPSEATVSVAGSTTTTAPVLSVDAAASSTEGASGTTAVPSTIPSTAANAALSSVVGVGVAATNPVAQPPASAKPAATVSTTQLLLPDYAAVRQTVKDLLALLQLYGPLTANQLEYNLPPVLPTAAVPWSVHDVLSILAAIGLVQQVAGTSQYCMHEGIPRADAILPTDLPAEINQAVTEAEASWKRSQLLRDALLDEEHPKQYKEVLRRIVAEYPQVVQDPVYWTALRNCHIVTTSTEKRTTPKSASQSSKAAASSAKGATSGSSNATKQAKAGPTKHVAAIAAVAAATSTSMTTSPAAANTAATATATPQLKAAVKVPTPKPQPAAAAPIVATTVATDDVTAHKAAAAAAAASNATTTDTAKGTTTMTLGVEVVAPVLQEATAAKPAVAVAAEAAPTS